MYTPFLGVLAAVKILGLGVKEGLARYGLRRGVAKYIVLGVATPYILYAISVALGLVVGVEIVDPVPALRSLGVELPVGGALALALIVLSAVINGSTINTLAAIGEEMGWRGLLLEELGSRLGLYPAAAAIGVV